MSQSRAASFLEQCFNVGSGFFIALLFWTYVIVPVYDIEVSRTQNLEITGLFTVVSIVRGYVWRRIFNKMQGRWHVLGDILLWPVKTTLGYFLLQVLLPQATKRKP